MRLHLLQQLFGPSFESKSFYFYPLLAQFLVFVVKNHFELWKPTFAGELHSLGPFTALLDFGLVRNPAPDRFSVQGEML